MPVDLTTAPVRDGDQLVGAVMTFTDRRPYEQLVEKHAAELADRAERHAAEREAQAEKYASLAARHEQLTAVLAESLRGPLDELRTQLGTLAADDAGQLWPEANQVLHHLAAGYARMTALVDNVLGYQRLDAGTEKLDKAVVLLDGVVAGGIDGAVELIGPGRAQFAVHAPPIEAEVDAARLTTALAHLVADVAGVDATGKSKADRTPSDSTIVVAAAQRGDVVRIEVRGPYAGGDPVHGPVVRGIVAAHAGVVQTHEVPGTSGGAYVLEVPLGAGRGTVPAPARNDAPSGGREALALPAQASGPVPASGPLHTSGPVPASVSGPVPASVSGPVPASGPVHPSGPVPASVSGPVPASGPASVPGPGVESPSVVAPGGIPGAGTSPDAAAETSSGGGRRRARRGSTDAFLESAVAPEGGAPGGAEPSGRRRARTGEPAGPAELIPAQQNAAVDSAAPAPVEPTGRRRGRPAEGSVVTAAEGAQGRAALGAAVPPQGVAVEPAGAPALARALPAVASAPEQDPQAPAQPSGRRRRALAAAQERAAAAEAGPRTPFALPPADADRDAETPLPAAAPVAGPLPLSDEGQHEAVRGVPGADHTPPQPHPHVPSQAEEATAVEPTGRRRAIAAPRPEEAPQPVPQSLPQPQPAPANGTGTGSVPLPPELPMPMTVSKDSTQGRAFSVRTLGQGVPFVPPAAQAAPASPAAPSNGSGRRRRLATPPEVDPPVPAALPAPAPAAEARPHPQPTAPAPSQHDTPAEGRAYAIGAPAEGSAEGPEPLDGPGGAVEVANRPAPRPVDDELPPEPLDNPRRLLVWPAPDVSTQQALSDRGYRPVIVHSREEVDAQIAAFPAALFVDPLTGPITRTALQSLRQAAVAAEVPVLLAAGLGQATREAAYGADPAVLLKALAPRDSEQHPSRVPLIEENESIAEALAATLERRGMQGARAATDTEAVALATRSQPNLVVMDLMQVRRRRAGIIDWLRANGQLNRTPLVVYTSADLVEEELPKLDSGETVLFLAERSNSAEVQARIVDLLAKIGTN
ncbi:PAS domain-containing protein [Streptomyces tanashiensis]